MDTMSAVGLHDMPENRLASDLDHRFGPEVCLFGDSSAKPGGKNNCFQRKLPHFVIPQVNGLKIVIDIDPYSPSKF